MTRSSTKRCSTKRCLNRIAMAFYALGVSLGAPLAVAQAAEATGAFVRPSLTAQENDMFAAVFMGKLIDRRRALGKLPKPEAIAADLTLDAKGRALAAKGYSDILDKAASDATDAKNAPAMNALPYAWWLASIDAVGSSAYAAAIFRPDLPSTDVPAIAPRVSEQHVRLPFGTGHALISILSTGGAVIAGSPTPCEPIAKSSNADMCPAAALITDASGKLVRVKTFTAPWIGLDDPAQSYEAVLSDRGRLTLKPVSQGMRGDGEPWAPMSVDIGAAP